MKVLVIGDVYGKVWRYALKKHLPELKKEYTPDCIVANIENISHGGGPKKKHIDEIEYLWIDVYTSWNHIFDNEKDICEYLESKEGKLLRPANFYSSKYVPLPWRGYMLLSKNEKRYVVINLISSVFFRHQVYNPFLMVREILEHVESFSPHAIIIDFHKEATAELAALALWLDGEVSLVFWTHTHVQTNDERILPKGTGMITDVGMVWPYESIIWASFETTLPLFLSWIPRWKIYPSSSSLYVFNWLFVEISEETKLCTYIEKIRIVWRKEP